MVRRLSTVGAALAALALVVPSAHAAGPPDVIGGFASSVESTRATLNTRVNPEGFATTYRFEYTSEASYLAKGFEGAKQAPVGGEAIGSGTSPISRSRQITGLTEATAYRYRVVATNSAGTTTGPARLLTTDKLGTEFILPDGRGWEMVSPVDKNGGEIQGFEANFGGDVLQAAADGNSATYSSRSSFASPKGAPPASQYISRRTASGWATENVSAPTEAGDYGDHPDGPPFQLFSLDLSSALMLNGCQAPCSRSYARRDNSTGVLTTVPLAAADLYFAGASPDLSHQLFTTGGDLYDFSGGQLRLINDIAGPDATLAAKRGAVSANGSRIYWAMGGDLYLREGLSSLLVDSGAVFQSASADGRFAYYVKAEHLFRYDAITHISSEYTLAPGSGSGGLLGFLGASEDSAYIYYVGTDGKLYLRHGAEDIPIAAAIDTYSYPPPTGTARLTTDGRRLLFVSSAELVAYDNRNATTGLPEPELYLYTADQDALTCVSCNPTGERPIGAASIPGTVANGVGEAATRAYKPRVFSTDGRRVLFDSFDRLAPLDTNQDRDVYEWEAQGKGSCTKLGGCIGPISSGTSEGGASFVDASATGADVFFLTDGALVKGDPPGKVDLYDARIGGGFPPPEEEEICVGDDCQPLPPEPEDPTPGSLRPGDPNPPLRKACKKGTVRKKGKCVKKKAHKKHKRKHHTKGQQ
jgi:hypothetical protein